MKADEWVGLEVDGQRVTEVRKAATPLDTSRGGTQEGVYFRRAVELVLADGTLAYGCTADGCRFTGNNGSSVASSHGRIHAKESELMGFGDWTLGQILGRLRDSEDDFDTIGDRHARAMERGLEVRNGLRAELTEAKKRIKELEKQISDMQTAGQKFFGAIQGPK